MKIENGEIIAGLSISNIRLDITKEELISIIGNDYEERVRNETDTTIIIENAEFWITSDGKVEQIGVWGDFQGKYKELIGIGSTLVDVKKYKGEYIEVWDTFELKKEKGICFELGDTEEDDEWDELKAPIEYIFVYRN